MIKKIDVYSFGIIMYEIYNGLFPCHLKQKRNISNLVQGITENNEPLFFKNDVKNSVKDLIYQCLSNDPKLRPTFDEIFEKLSKNKDYFLDRVDKDEINMYNEKLETFKSLAPQSNQYIFLDDIKKKQYLVMQEAKKEIYQLKSHYLIHKNLDFKIDLQKIKNNSRTKFIFLTKSNPKDQKIEEIANCIEKTIDQEYNDLYKMLEFDLYASSSSKALKKLIDIFEKQDNDQMSDDDDNYGIFSTICSMILSSIRKSEKNEDDESAEVKEIQNKINDVISKHPDHLLFDIEKLRSISNSKSKLSEILSSLKGIQKNPKCHPKLKIENPYSYVLYSMNSEKFSYLKSLSNILTGDCFFVTLYGKQNLIYEVLSLLTKDDSIRKYKKDDLISIYGSISFASFVKKVPSLFDKLKQFNIFQTNLYFISVSDEKEDETYKKWCNFVSFISHITIFIPDSFESAIKWTDFNNLFISETNTFIKWFNFELDDSHIFEEKICQLFDILCENFGNLLPHETVENIFQMIFNQNKIVLPFQLKQTLTESKSENYSLRMLNTSREYFNKYSENIIKKLYSIVKENKSAFNFQYYKTEILEKIKEFLFINTYPQFWDEKCISYISKVLLIEVDKELSPLFESLKKTEEIGNLISKIVMDPNSILKNGKLFLQHKNLKVTNVKNLPIPKSINDLNQIKSILQSKYDDLIKLVFEQEKKNEILDSIMESLFSFLNRNPTASDIEYGEFYLDLFQKYYDPLNITQIIRYFQFVLFIREVLPEYTISIKSINNCHGNFA